MKPIYSVQNRFFAFSIDIRLRDLAYYKETSAGIL